MLNYKTPVLLRVLLFISPAIANAAVPPIPACPTSLEPPSIKIEAAEGGWVPFVKAPMYLFSATAIDGPPERHGDLVPSGGRQGKGAWSSTYTFEGSYPEGKWLQCSYGQTNQLTLSRRLPDTITACTFTYRKGEKVGQNDITIVCR